MKLNIRNPKIAISGAASVGKTTISKYLSEKYGLTYISEFVDEKLQYLNVYSLKEINPNKQVEIQKKMFFEKYNAENQHLSFVSDRSLVDYFVFWINRCMYHVPEKETKTLFNILEEHVKIYDFIFLLRFDKKLFQEHTKRTNNFFAHLRFEWILRSLYIDLGANVIDINETSIEAKTKLIVESVNHCR